MSNNNDFQLTDNERELLQAALNIGNTLTGDQAADPIPFDRDAIPQHLNEYASQYDVDEARLYEICENITDPLYENRQTPTYEALSTRLRDFGVDVPEVEPASPENTQDPSDSPEQEPANSSPEKDSNPGGKKAKKDKDSEKENEASEQLGLTPEQKYDVQREIRQQKREMKNSALSNPAALMGQAGAYMFRGIRNLFDNAVLGKAWKYNDVGPFKPSLRKSREVISDNDQVNELKGNIAGVKAKVESGDLNPTELIDRLGEIEGEYKKSDIFSPNSNLKTEDKTIIDDSLKSLDATLKEKGFYEKSPESQNKMKEVQESFKKLFQNLFAKKGPKADEPSPG